MDVNPDNTLRTSALSYISRIGYFRRIATLFKNPTKRKVLKFPLSFETSRSRNALAPQKRRTSPPSYGSENSGNMVVSDN